jgi:hypothetical protein
MPWRLNSATTGKKDCSKRDFSFELSLNARRTLILNPAKVMFPVDLLKNEQAHVCH